MIPCNELNQVKSYLLQQFKICKKLSAEDMQLFVNYVHSLSICSLKVDLGYIPASDQGTITNTAGDDAVIPLATQEFAGLFSPEEKLLLENTTQDGLISGGIVSWSGTGFIYNVSQAFIKLNGILLPPIEADIVTLVDSDLTNPRIDVVYVDADGFGVLTGTPAADPVMPQIDPSTQIFLTSIIVAANTTQPDPGEVPTNTIYAENTVPPEWSGIFTGIGTVDFESTVAPRTGTKSIEFTNVVSGGRITMTADANFDLNDIDSTNFWLRLKSNFVGQQNLQVYFRDENNIQLTSATNISFNKSQVGEYQFVAVSINSLNNLGNGTIARKIILRFTTNNLNPIDGFFVDDWIIQGGIEQPSPILNEHDQLQGIKGNGTFHLSEEERDKLNSMVSDRHYTYSQNIPESLWIITHNLNKKPSVTIVDSANDVVDGLVSYQDENNLTITFSAPFSGKAYIN